MDINGLYLHSNLENRQVNVRGYEQWRILMLTMLQSDIQATFCINLDVIRYTSFNINGFL